MGSTTSSHTVGSTQGIETRGGNSGSWYGSKLESGNSTTNYTTVSGTMGQPFSGLTQTGFNTMTLYGTAAQTGFSGMYGSYGTVGTVTPTPFTYVLSDGEPPVSTPGGRYSGSESGIVFGFKTPVSVQTGQFKDKTPGPGNGVNVPALQVPKLVVIDKTRSETGKNPYAQNYLLFKLEGYSDSTRNLNGWILVKNTVFWKISFDENVNGLNNLKYYTKKLEWNTAIKVREGNILLAGGNDPKEIFTGSGLTLMRVDGQNGSFGSVRRVMEANFYSSNIPGLDEKIKNAERLKYKEDPKYPNFPFSKSDRGNLGWGIATKNDIFPDQKFIGSGRVFIDWEQDFNDSMKLIGKYFTKHRLFISPLSGVPIIQK